MSTSRLALTRPEEADAVCVSADYRALAGEGQHREVVGPRRAHARRSGEGGARMNAAMIEALTVDIGGHALVLSAGARRFDPVRKPFYRRCPFGKDAVFRARGIPVPEGSTAANARAPGHPDRDASAGDHRIPGRSACMHGNHMRTSRWRVAEWRERHAVLRLILVEGNHDRHAGGAAGRAGVEVV